MTKLIAGLDEVATETQKSEGWCYFCIPQAEYTKFENEVQSLIAGTTKLTSFHGKKFKNDQAAEYEQFLKIIRKYAENSVPTILSCTLSSENWKEQFLGFCTRVTSNVFTQVGVTNSELITVCQQLTPGLFSFMRLVNHLGSKNELAIEINCWTFQPILLRVRAMRPCIIFTAKSNYPLRKSGRTMSDLWAKLLSMSALLPAYCLLWKDIVLLTTLTASYWTFFT